MNLSGQYQSQVLNNGSQVQNSYPVVVQKPAQLIPVSQMYSHPQQMVQPIQKVSFVQTAKYIESGKKQQQPSQQMVQISKTQSQMIQGENIKSVIVNEASSLFLQEKQRWVEREGEYKSQIDALAVSNKKLTELVKLNEMQNHQLRCQLSQVEENNQQIMQNFGKSVSVEKMKLIERNQQEQSEFMEQIRKKQVEEYEEILEENRKLQLEINKLTREKESLNGRLEIVRQEANDNQERRGQINILENKLKERELEIFRSKQKESQLEMKIEELFQVNRKLSEGAELQLGHSDELGRRMQLAEQKERDAVEIRSRMEKHVEEIQQKMNQQQEYLNKLLEQIAGLQRENEQLGKQLSMDESERMDLEEEVREQQRYTMEVVGRLKATENQRLILEDKIEKQEKLVRMLQSKEEYLRDNGDVINKLEEIIEQKNWEIQQMEKKFQSIEGQVGMQAEEITNLLKSKEAEIYKVLRMNKQLGESKKKYKELVKEKDQEIKKLVEKLQSMEQGLLEKKQEQMNNTNRMSQEIENQKKQLEDKIKKLYEDNQILFNENKEIKETISKQEKYKTIQENIVGENQSLKNQIEQIIHKYEQIHQQEKIQTQQLQSQFKLTEEQYSLKICQLESTLNKLRNGNLQSKVYGQYSFESLQKDFLAIQQDNQFLVEQLRQYEGRFENFQPVSNKYYEGRCKICQQVHNDVPLTPVQMNIQKQQTLRNKKSMGSIQTFQTMGLKDEGLNTKIYNRCREITTKY